MNYLNSTEEARLWDLYKSFLESQEDDPEAAFTYAVKRLEAFNRQRETLFSDKKTNKPPRHSYWGEG